MRLASIKNLEPESKLGKTLYSTGGLVLLRQGAPIRDSYISKMEKLGYTGAYVQDAFSEDIDIPDVIPERLRRGTVDHIRSSFRDFQKGPEKAERHMAQMQKAAGELMEAVMGFQPSIINVADLKILEEYTYQHSVNVAVLSLVIGKAAGLNSDQLRDLALAAMLHDVGVMFLDQDMLAKTTPLSQKELKEIQTHAEKGFTFVRSHCRVATTTFVSILQHHERFDGNGYPRNFCRDNIHRYARIIAICDVYDSMTSARHFRPAYSPSEAYEYIMANAGAHFDPDFVQIFARKIAPYPEGSMVRLSTGQTAMVVENRSHLMMRPKVRVFASGVEGSRMPVLDLAEELSVTVLGVA